MRPPELPARNPGAFETIFWWLFVATYSVSIVLLHRQGNLTFGRLSDSLGMPLYLSGSRVVAGVGGILILLVLIRGLIQSRAKLRAFLLFLPVMLLFDQTLISVPIERIHYPQYGFLAWIAYMASGNQYMALMITFLVGYVDEAFQYWVLYADDRFVYFDWNDITLNLTAAVGVFLFFMPPAEPGRRFSKKQILAAVGTWIVSVGLVTRFWNPDRWLPGNQVNAFWIVTNIETTYHVMKAHEGLLLLGTFLIVAVGYYFPGRSPRVDFT